MLLLITICALSELCITALSRTCNAGCRALADALSQLHMCSAIGMLSSLQLTSQVASLALYYGAMRGT